MPPPKLKTTILRTNSSFDRDRFLAWTKDWLSRNATDEEIGFAFAIDLKNLEQVLSIIFSQEVMEQLNIPADLQVIDVVGVIINAVTRNIRESLGDEIADMIAAAIPDTPDQPQTATITQEQFDALAERLQSAITINVPDKAQVQIWTREGMANELDALQRQMADLTRFVTQMQAGGAVMPPSFEPYATPPIAGTPSPAAASSFTLPTGSDLPSILPDSATPLALALEQIYARRLSRITTPIKDLWNPDTCPEHLLPWLAWSVGVRVWDDAWPLSIKREVIRRSIQILKMGGTPTAVRAALNTLGIACTLNEWFDLDEDGQRYGEFPDFFVTVETADVARSAMGGNRQFGTQVKQVLNRVKPVRSGVNLRFVTRSQTTLQIATTAATRARHSARLAPRIPPVQAASTLQIAATARVRNRHRAVIRPIALLDLKQTTTLQIATTARVRARHTATVVPTATIQTVQTTYTYPLGRTAIRVRARSSHTLEIAA